MISSVKEFGSYKLVAHRQFDEEDDGDAVCVGECAISNKWQEVELLQVDRYNHDTSIFRFALPDGHKQLKLPLGGFLLVNAPVPDHDGMPPSIRPYTSITDEDVMLVECEKSSCRPYFELMCKRYDQWGIKESIQTHFLFTKTDHSYRPPGVVSNYIHSLRIGDRLAFKHNDLCRGKLHNHLQTTKFLTLIAVGVGVAPMVQIIRSIIKDRQRPEEERRFAVEKVVLLYGARTVADILQRETFEAWQAQYTDIVTIVFCVGSRWANVHWGAKKKGEYLPPPPPVGFTSLQCPAELGWVSEEKILKYAHPPSSETKVVVCGLPGVYAKICGHREASQLSEDSALYRLGYTESMVIKL